MNIIGLNCLLTNITDEQPEIANKKIRRLEVVRKGLRNYLLISFCDGTSTSYKLFEVEECDEE